MQSRSVAFGDFSGTFLYNDCLAVLSNFVGGSTIGNSLKAK